MPSIQESNVTLSPEEIECLARWSRTRGRRRTLANTFPPPHPPDLGARRRHPRRRRTKAIPVPSGVIFAVGGRPRQVPRSQAPPPPGGRRLLPVAPGLSVFQRDCRTLLVFRSPSHLLLERAPPYPGRRNPASRTSPPIRRPCSGRTARFFPAARSGARRTHQSSMALGPLLPAPPFGRKNIRTKD